MLFICSIVLLTNTFNNFVIFHRMCVVIYSASAFCGEKTAVLNSTRSSFILSVDIKTNADLVFVLGYTDKIFVKRLTQPQCCQKIEYTRLIANFGFVCEEFILLKSGALMSVTFESPFQHDLWKV